MTKKWNNLVRVKMEGKMIKIEYIHRYSTLTNSNSFLVRIETLFPNIEACVVDIRQKR